VQLAVLIAPRAVEASPARLGAGPVALEITNQAARTLRLTVADRAGKAGSSAPIDPGGTGEMTVELVHGAYTINAVATHSSDAQLASGDAISPAHLEVGPPRASGNNTLLQP
jgi:hypothetical protein